MHILHQLFALPIIKVIYVSSSILMTPFLFFNKSFISLFMSLPQWKHPWNIPKIDNCSVYALIDLISMYIPCTIVNSIFPLLLIHSDFFFFSPNGTINTGQSYCRCPVTKFERMNKWWGEWQAGCSMQCQKYAVPLVTKKIKPIFISGLRCSRL